MESLMCEVLHKFLQENTILDKERDSRAKEQCKALLDAAKNDQNKPAFCDFCSKFGGYVKSAVYLKDSRYVLKATKLEKTWMHFHQLRLTVLKDLWSSYLGVVGLASVDPILLQYVNTEIFQAEIRHNLESTSESNSSKAPPPLTKDDENAMQYACGYVPYKLLLKYEKSDDDRSVRYVDCLRSMAVVGKQDSIFDYTREWLKKVNRGGLFPLNDVSYCFFMIVETLVKSEIAASVLPASGGSADIIKDKVVTDDDVLHLWSLVSGGYIDDEEESMHLLKDVTRLWITVRGFSLAASWMETYKKETKKVVKYNPALRPSLKRKHPDSKNNIDSENDADLHHDD